ncbi:MAG: trehalase family glycosidase, partial [Anaerolineae bacterium]|nr:trehalase family glycosidase [Anaerolineae bacterium]
DIAEVLGRKAEARELRLRAEEYQAALRWLWDEDSGIFLNQRTDTGQFSRRLSPTNFYAMLGKAATQAQAVRMVTEHLYNPFEFWGDWILPSISRDDPAFADQSYWRGRIWAPMNMLVYLALCNYELPQARADLAVKSVQLLLKEWRENGHVHENYSAVTGEGCDKLNSDRFYHWGGLLGLIAFVEAGYMGDPSQSLQKLT